MLKGKLARKAFSYAVRKSGFSIKTTTGAPADIVAAGNGYCYNVYDDTWYVYSGSLAAWVQIG